MRDLSQLEVFVAVVECGSFTAAAQGLGTSKSFASRQVRELEDRLGARLLNRTTRKLTLTDIGAVFFERCRRLLNELDEAEAAVLELQTTLHGRLRLSVPMGFGVRHVVPAINDFMATYRELEVDVHFADRRVDLIDEGYDLAIRIGPLVDSTLIARPLATSEFYVCASPRYIEAHGEPQSPEELGLHECLSYAYQATGSNWQLHSDGKEQTIPVRGGRLSTNNGDCLLGAVRAGLGLSLLPDFFVADDLRTGALRRVLAPWRQQSLVCAVYPHNRHLSTKIRTFVGFLADRWRIPPWAQCRAPSALQAGMGA